MKKLLFLALASLVLIAGCSNKIEPTPTPTPETTPETTETPEANEEGLAGLASTIKGLDSIKEISFIDIDETMFSTLYGVDLETTKSFAVLKPMIEQVAFEVIMVEANDGKIDSVKAAIDAYVTTKTEDAFYPANVEAYQNAQVIENGNFYVIIVGDQDNVILPVVEEALANGI